MVWKVIENSKEKDTWYNSEEEFCNPNIIFKYLSVNINGILKKTFSKNIKYNKYLSKDTNNDVYNIIRGQVNDGSLIHEVILLNDVFKYIFSGESYNKITLKEYNKRPYKICYQIGDLNIKRDFDDPEFPMCQRVIYSLPVVAYYMENEEEYNKWCYNNSLKEKNE